MNYKIKYKKRSKLENILNKIYNHNAIEGLERLYNKYGECVDLIVTDPPYKIVQGGCTNKAVRLSGSVNLDKGEIFKHNDIKFSEWIPLLYKILKPDSHCYIMTNDRNMYEMLHEAQKAGFKLLNILTWKKTKHAPNRYYLKNSEFIIFLRKGKAKNINNMGTFQVIEVDNVDKKQHPSEKPVELMKIFIENSSNEGDIVLDPFMGSGTVAVAAKNSGRKYIGFELDKEYCDIANKRLEE